MSEATRHTVDAKPSWWALVLLGAVAGVLSGLFGVGGGVLIVPALVMALGMGQRRAHGTSLAAVIPISIVGAGAYLARGTVDLRIAGLLMTGTVVGAIYGVRLLRGLPEGVLRWSFIAFMVFVALRMFFEDPQRGIAVELTTGLVVTLIVLGLVTGVLSGLLGVGGGVFMVPVMVVLLGISDTAAKGISLLVVIPTGVVATVLSARAGNVDLRTASIVGLAGAFTSVFGASLAFLLEPRVAAVLFAVFLIGVAVRMSVQAVRKSRKTDMPALEDLK